jgi:hypothetical protein
MKLIFDVNLNESEIKDFADKVKEIENRSCPSQSKRVYEDYGIDGSTFRAFRNMDKPSQKYREQAKICALQLESDNFKSITCQAEFDLWHLKFAESFNRAFDNQLIFSQKMKLTDLFFKWAFQNERFESSIRNVIYKYAYCALDSIILKKMNLCFKNILPMGGKISMGDIKEQTTYQFCQRLIDSIVAACNTTRIVFDIWAWEKRTNN